MMVVLLAHLLAQIVASHLTAYSVAGIVEELVTLLLQLGFQFLDDDQLILVRLEKVQHFQLLLPHQ
jgi:hypothetical protein